MALWRVRATVDDRPGYLAVLTASLALRAVNILTVQVHTTEAGAVDDFLVDAPDSMSEMDLLAAVERGRGRDAWVAPADAQGLADQPARVLSLASRLVRDPDGLGDVLCSLLDARLVTWRPAPRRSGRGLAGGIMVLPEPAGGCYEVVREEPAFTPAEYARAQAMVDLASSVVRRDGERVTVVLADGAEATVRPGTIDDAPAVSAMHERSSTASRHGRYLGSPVPSTPQLNRLLEPAHGMTLVAVADGGVGEERLVAMANLVCEGRIGQIGLLVEDAWQRRGLGTALLRRLVAHAAAADCATLVAHTQADNAGILHTLRRIGTPGAVGRDGGVLTVTVPLLVGAEAPAETPAESEA
jgi:GNAT superfamily N-acetyltransferase